MALHDAANSLAVRYPSELCGCSVLNSAPCLERQWGMLDAPEPVHAQRLVTHPAVGRLGEAVLLRFARFDVVCGGSVGLQPLGQLERDGLGTVEFPIVAGTTASASLVDSSITVSTFILCPPTVASDMKLQLHTSFGRVAAPGTEA